MGTRGQRLVGTVDGTHVEIDGVYSVSNFVWSFRGDVLPDGDGSVLRGKVGPNQLSAGASLVTSLLTLVAGAAALALLVAAYANGSKVPWLAVGVLVGIFALGADLAYFDGARRPGIGQVSWDDSQKRLRQLLS